MIRILIFLIFLCGFLLLQYIRSILEIRSLYRQLEEIERGSHIELTIQTRQKHMLALCRKLNQIQKLQYQNQIRYEKAEKQLKQNITSLAHDIRTPLTGATGYVQLAKECDKAEQQIRYLQAAENRMKELENMLEELFLYTKLTSEEYELTIQKIQVLPLLSDCLIGLYWQFEEKGIVPEILFESESICVWADEESLRRIFHNLIQNALLHGIGGIKIYQKNVPSEKNDTSSKSSDTLSQNQLIYLIFENTVSETSKPDTTQIFEQFYKADSARRKGSSGLGLFIVKELMEKMNGGVRAELKKDILKILLEFNAER